MAGTCVIIPSFRSWENLRLHLPPLLEEVRPQGVDVIVSDDASPDETADRVETEFPEVRVLRREVNGGFGENCNWAIRAAQGYARVFLMNTDVRVRPGFLQPLEEQLADPEVFAVSSVATSEDGTRVEDGPRLGRLRRGLMKWRRLDLDRLETIEAPLATLYPVAAHTLVDRQKFLDLGGFDPLYRPFYWEDADLGYRALKRGWRVLVEPRSRVHHVRKRSDIQSAVTSALAARVIYRNRFLFLWANLHDPALFWGRHLAPTALRVAYGWLLLDGRFYRGLASAVRRLPEALRSRRRARAEAVRGDREVLAEVERQLAGLLAGSRGKPGREGRP